jgi:hypothetical protein
MRILEWKFGADGTFPKPVVEDDRKTFPDSLVKNILQWLEVEAARARANRKPDNQVIMGYEGVRLPGSELGSRDWMTPEASKHFRDPITGKQTPTEIVPGLGAWEFESGTAEILLRDKKTKAILVRYHFMTAREIHSNAMILGPELWAVQEGALA